MSNVAGKDKMLALLVQAIDTSGGELSITLNVQGTIVSGTLVGNSEYFAHTGILFSEAQKRTEGTEGLAGLFSEAAKLTRERNNNADEAALPEFIHLKDAHFLEGGKTIPSTPVLWRGRLSQVDGFVFGTYSEVK